MGSNYVAETSRSGTVYSTVWWRALISLLLLLSCVLPGGGRWAATAATDDYALHVQPRVCVVVANEATCAMQLTVSWTAPATTDVCVKLAHADNTLRCWQQQRLGNVEFELQRSSNTIVQLLDASSNQVLTETEITIVSRELRDSRRRRRHVWSIL